MSKGDDLQRRKALESGRGTKSNRKRVAENMTEDWLQRQANKLRDVGNIADPYSKYSEQLLEREMKTYETLDRIKNKRK